MATGQYNSTLPTWENGQQTTIQTDSRGRALVSPSTSAEPGFTSPAPTSAAGGALVPVVGRARSALVVKASAGNLYGASMTAGATAGFLIAYNASSAPAADAALTEALTIYCVPVLANGFASVGDPNMPDRFGAGITLLFSTSSTTYTVPANLALHMRGKAA